MYDNKMSLALDSLIVALQKSIDEGKKNRVAIKEEIDRSSQVTADIDAARKQQDSKSQSDLTNALTAEPDPPTEEPQPKDGGGEPTNKTAEIKRTPSPVSVMTVVNLPSHLPSQILPSTQNDSKKDSQSTALALRTTLKLKDFKLVKNSANAITRKLNQHIFNLFNGDDDYNKPGGLKGSYESEINRIRQKMEVSPDIAEMILMVQVGNVDPQAKLTKELDLILNMPNSQSLDALQKKKEKQISDQTDRLNRQAAWNHALNLTLKIYEKCLRVKLQAQAAGAYTSSLLNMVKSIKNNISDDQLKAFTVAASNVLGPAAGIAAAGIPVFFNIWENSLGLSSGMTTLLHNVSFTLVSFFAFKGPIESVLEAFNIITNKGSKDVVDGIFECWHWLFTQAVTTWLVNLSVFFVASKTTSLSESWVVMPAVLHFVFRHGGIAMWNKLCTELNLRPEDQNAILQERAERLKEKLTKIHGLTREDKNALVQELRLVDSENDFPAGAAGGESKESGGERTQIAKELFRDLTKYREMQSKVPNPTETGLVHFIRRTVGAGKNGISHGAFKTEFAAVALSSASACVLQFFWQEKDSSSGTVSIMLSSERILFENQEQYDVWEVLQAANDANNPEAVGIMNTIFDAQDYDIPVSMRGTLMGQLFVAGRVFSTGWHTVKGLGGQIVGQFISPKGMEVMDDPEEFVKESLSNMTGGGFMVGTYTRVKRAGGAFFNEPVAVRITKEQENILRRIAGSSPNVRNLHLNNRRNTMRGSDATRLNREIGKGTEIEYFLDEAEQDLYSTPEIAQESLERATDYENDVKDLAFRHPDFYQQTYEHADNKMPRSGFWSWLASDTYDTRENFLLKRLKVIAEKAGEWVQKHSRYKEIENTYKTADINLPMRKRTSEEIETVESDWNFVNNFRQQVWKMLKGQTAQDPDLTALFDDANRLIMTVVKTFTVNAIGSLAKVYYEAQLQKIDAVIGSPTYFGKKNQVNGKMKKIAKELRQWYTFDADGKLKVKDNLQMFSPRDWRQDANLALGMPASVLKSRSIGNSLQRQARTNYASAKLIRVKYHIEECEEEEN